MSYLSCDECGLSVRVRAPAFDLDCCPRCGSPAVLRPAPPRPRRRSSVIPVRTAVAVRRSEGVGTVPRMDPA